MTITSVGFGDVTASAFNVGEQICCAAIMFLTALLWGYLVGVFCTLAAAAPNVQAFRDELSQLNSFMSDHNLPSELRFRLRECECPRVKTKASRPPGPSSRDLLTPLTCRPLSLARDRPLARRRRAPAFADEALAGDAG